MLISTVTSIIHAYTHAVFRIIMYGELTPITE